ncbi:hypothetical protein, partial [Escherichia coli]|uniref:hypothetical protein n=1 Tax=Escherichia coli TaxID=562 RepID=UPI0020255CD5
KKKKKKKNRYKEQTRAQTTVLTLMHTRTIKKKLCVVIEQWTRQCSGWYNTFGVGDGQVLVYRVGR